MRLFIAIYPPKEYIRYFADVIKYFDKEKRNLKPTPVDQIHLTLKFIGANVSQPSASKIIAALKEHEGEFTKPFIKVENIQFGFSYQRDPRHLLAMLDDGGELVDLADEVHDTIRELKLRDTIRWKDKFSNNFHITLARLKDTATKSSGKNILKISEKLNLIPPEGFTPERIDFVESIVSPTEYYYKKIESVTL